MGEALLPEPPLLVFRVEIYDMHGVVFAASNPKARWIAVCAYWQAGYGSKKLWPRPKACRAQGLDRYATGRNSNTVYSEEYLR